MKYKKIALIGMMGCGKTTIANILSEKLNLDKVDSDEIFVKNFGEIKDYFAKYGEDSFRHKESLILSEIVKKESFVLASGGGIILEEVNRELLFNSDVFTIYLKASPETIYKRLKNDSTRPLLETSNKVRTIIETLNKREEYYSKADLIVDVNQRTPERIVQDILKKLSGNSKIQFFGAKTSEIIIKKGISDEIENYLDENTRYFVITNTTVKNLYPKFISKFGEENTITIKDGEKYKNYKTFNFIIEELLAKKIERQDCIIALGGGVVGDLAGFVASSILRGVKLIQIPTTLLAMCDSSIGGKTGYNTEAGKNLVGSFYLADKVFIDSNFINTLDEYEFKCGLGEIVKYALIEKSCKYSKEFNLINYLKFSNLEKIYNNIDEIIEICASLKTNVVNLDNKELGLRKVLNFGHTFAHPIETLTNYKKYSHGEAVAYGIKYASRLSYNLGKINGEYLNLINQILCNFELAQDELKLQPNKIIELMKNDKKVKDGKINLLLPTAPAVVELFDNTDLPLIEVSLI